MKANREKKEIQQLLQERKEEEDKVNKEQNYEIDISLSTLTKKMKK